MDWSNVTYDELLTSLREVHTHLLGYVCSPSHIVRENTCVAKGQTDLIIMQLVQVDWSQPPRPASDFFSRFSFPSTTQKLQQRLKCNVYYYRSNYALVVLVSFIIAFIRRPTALLSILAFGFGALCLNDTFATMLR